MTDPTRLIDDPHAPPAVRRALRAEMHRPAPEALRTAVWAALASHGTWSSGAAAGSTSAAAAAAGATGTGKVGAMGAVSWGLVKSFGFGIGIGTTLALGAPAVISALEPPVVAPAESRVTAPRAPATAAAEARVPNEPPSPRAAPPLAEKSLPAATTAAEPPPPAARRAPRPATAQPAPHAVTSRAAEEAARVALARRRLRQGEGHGALEELAELDRNLPGGVLAQEREALRIEALVNTRQNAAAREAAQRFLQRYPESPHVDRVRMWAGL